MNTDYPALPLLVVASNLLEKCSEQIHRRRVSVTVGPIVLALGLCIAMPAAMLRAAEDEPTAAAATDMKPKLEVAQTLFTAWQANVRTDGKIPGALIGKLGAELRFHKSRTGEGNAVRTGQHR